MTRQASAIRGGARRSRASAAATSPIGRVPRQSWQQHHPAGDGGAERRGDEADERREPERDRGVDEHRVDARSGTGVRVSSRA